MKSLFPLVFLSIILSAPAWAGKAHVVDGRAEKGSDGSWTVHATVQHDDDGWEHYADRWEILAEDGTLLDTRVLFHPHTPKPFTRSIPGAKIPPGTSKVRLRAHDKVHGYGGREFILTLPQP